jgi:hypothetical protein
MPGADLAVVIQHKEMAVDVSRRGFLGSVLGTYVATQNPWYARLVRGQGKDRPFSLLDAGPDELMQCKSALVLADGMIIKGPSIKGVARPGQKLLVPHPCLSEEAEETFRFVFAPVNALQSFTSRAIILLDPYGKRFLESPYSSGSQLVTPGDTLRLCQTIGINWVS